MRYILVLSILLTHLNLFGQNIEFSLRLDKSLHFPVEIIGDPDQEHVLLPPTPEFPGGMKALDEYLKENGRLTVHQVKNDAIVFVEFTINEKGFSEGIKIIKVTGIDGDKSNPEIIDDRCRQEVIRLLWNMPRWYAAVEEGKVVKAKMILPIFVTIK